MKTAGVYAIVNLVSGRRYVGSSNHITRRWKEHLSDLRRGLQPSEPLQSDWFALGEQSFGFVILETVSGDKRARVKREQFHINQTVDLYNVSRRAGSGPRDGFRHRPESIAKMHANRGRVFGPEMRARVSASRKGRKFPRHAEALRGRKLSAETRAKMSASRTGIVRTPEWRAHLSAALKGKPCPPGRGAHISAAKRGRPWSDAQYIGHGLPVPPRTIVVDPTTQLASMAECAEAIAGRLQ